ncbi:hypothetical protein ScPMuIL_009592 [Solemya velum]
MLQKIQTSMDIRHMYRDEFNDTHMAQIGDSHNSEVYDYHKDEVETADNLWMRRSLLSLAHFHNDKNVPAEVLTEVVNECLLDYEYTRQIFWDRMHATVSSAIMEVDESDNENVETQRQARSSTKKPRPLALLASLFRWRQKNKKFRDSSAQNDVNSVDDKKKYKDVGKKHPFFRYSFRKLVTHFSKKQ